MNTNNSISEITGKISNFLKSGKAIITISIFFGLALLLGSFSIGMAVGIRKARFSYAVGDNYHRNFGGPRGGFMEGFGMDLNGKDFIGAHGTFGQIISIVDPEIVVKGKDNVEKIIVVSANTDIRRFREAIKLKDLMVDDSIVVIGEPDDQGKIEAKFIRILPMPSPTMMHMDGSNI